MLDLCNSFYCGKIHERKLTILTVFEAFFTVQFCGIKDLHLVVQTSPASVSSLSFLKEDSLPVRR